MKLKITSFIVTAIIFSVGLVLSILIDDYQQFGAYLMLFIIFSALWFLIHDLVKDWHWKRRRKK